jgi:hypothetical protein
MMIKIQVLLWGIVINNKLDSKYGPARGLAMTDPLLIFLLSPVHSFELWFNCTVAEFPLCQDFSVSAICLHALQSSFDCLTHIG